ncbi:MAG TPA: oxygen-independent coproporphyrinogen III oxidase [Thermoanaerobacterales bacterium]|nr:oxygen-independent coproporphyrinogen III oxidase [Thermoanaerobacterales bacterium]
MTDNMLGLYIHIPFCRAKCNYCDFVSYTNMEHIIPEYIKMLKKEMEYYKNYCSGKKIKSVYIGGGTPTMLQSAQLKSIMESVYSNFVFCDEMEISIEANPESVTKEKLNTLKNIGVNRISIGLQTDKNHLLKKIGRVHTFGDFKKAFLIAREEGFENINIDLIFGLPSQTVEHWLETLGNIVDLKPEHISAYSLEVGRGTRLYEQYKKGVIKLPKEEKEREMYHLLIEFLTTAEYTHYELSNFAKQGRECRHNIIYWENKEYIGMGAASHSYFNKKRYYNTENIKSYINQLKNELPIKKIEETTVEQEISETIIMNLRLIKGLDKMCFLRRFGVDIKKLYEHEIKQLKEIGLIKEDKRYISLTCQGLDLANEVFIKFI